MTVRTGCRVEEAPHVYSPWRIDRFLHSRREERKPGGAALLLGRLSTQPHIYTHQGIRATPLCLLHPLFLLLLLLRAVQISLALGEGGVAVVYLLKVRALSVCLG